MSKLEGFKALEQELNTPGIVSALEEFEARFPLPSEPPSISEVAKARLSSFSRDISIGSLIASGVPINSSVIISRQPPPKLTPEQKQAVKDKAEEYAYISAAVVFAVGYVAVNSWPFK